MATLTTKLTVTGSSADYGAAVALSQTNTLDVSSPFKGISRLDLASGSTEVVYADAGSNGTVFCYIRNNNTTGSGYLDLQIDNGNNTFGTLENGEFAWIPVDKNEGVQVIAGGATVEVEYAYWSRT